MNQPPFSAAPAELQKAFEGLRADDHSVTVLLEEGRYEFETAEKYTYRLRKIFKTWTKAGAEGWAMVEHTWAPWEEERPVIKARVISQSGAAHQLDPKTIAESAVRDGDVDILTDRRMLKAPLPAVEAGSIVEIEITERHTRAPFAAGGVHSFYFGYGVPIERTKLTIRGPVAVPFRLKVHQLPQAVVKDASASGVREIAVEQGPMKPLEDVPPFLPPDAPRGPHVAFSTGKDWATLATGYSAIVDQQLKGFNAANYLPKFSAGAGREEKILAIVEKLNREIRYTGIEFAEATVIPHSPDDVVKRKYGDCKDKSSLAVALLRAAGIPAHVALLRSSSGKDVEQELPGMHAFNHAIVYVPGEPDFWLDLTDPDVRLGVIAPSNQGRFALVARAQTTGLMRTPELTAEDNRAIETREFLLPELGRAKIIETTETFGAVDRVYRGEFGGASEKDLRESLKSYVEKVYGEAKISRITTGDDTDLQKPMTLRIELENAQRGSSGRTEAAVGIFLSHIADRLPVFFREEQKKDPEKPARPERTQDYVIAEPFTSEWRYRITAPAGFKIRQLPEAQDEKLAFTTLTARYARENDTTVTATFRFVMPKKRFTAAEGKALREAMVELGQRKALLIYFDQIGETHLASGNVKDAIAEFDKLRKAHPKEALHFLQNARAMLAAGAGNAARAEARRAVALEPDNAQAYVQLAEVLKHDLVGRPMEKGFDRDGAAAAYRKALELDPSDNETRANLAILLEYDTSAIRYGEGAKVNEAIDEYKKILDKLAGLGVPQNYAIALFRGGRAEELRDHLRRQPDSELNQVLKVCAEALLAGSKAAASRASEVSGVNAKQRVLASAGQTLIAVRQYELAADLFEAAAVGAPNPAAVANLVQTLRKTKRIPHDLSVIKEPEDTVRMFFARVISLDRHEKDWMTPLSKFMLEGQSIGAAELSAIRRGMGTASDNLRENGLTPAVVLDLTHSALQFAREGNDEAGYVIRASVPGNAAAQNLLFFVLREDETYRIVAMTGEFDGVARLALDLAEAGRIDQAKVWLDRVRLEIPNSGGDDALAGSRFAKLWSRSQAADQALVKRAAASLMTNPGKRIGRITAILEESRKTATTAAAPVVAAELAQAYLFAGQHAKAMQIGEELMKSLPESATALDIALRSAYASGDRKAADRILDANLPRFKDDIAALRMVASVALGFGDADRCIAITKAIVDSGRAEATDYNQLAWADLVAGKVTAASIETASKGITPANPSPAILHTLAAVAAEIGRGSDARATLLQRMKLEGADQPDDEEWYVFGRIAEQYGLLDEAETMYRRLTKPKNEAAIPATSYGLAQRRLKAMGK